MMILQVVVGTVIGLAWFCSGAIFPVVSCWKCQHFDTEDFYMIPLSGIFGPVALACFILQFNVAKERTRRREQ